MSAYPHPGNNGQPRYKVRFYNRQKGGIWSRIFAVKSDAEAFAEGQTLYARKARVEELPADHRTEGRQ